MDNKDLLEAINQVMPYGKYKGRQLLLALKTPRLAARMGMVHYINTLCYDGWRLQPERPWA